MSFSKKKQDNSGLDVLTEIKEPFSFANFYEDHVIGTIKKIKKFLDEKGILFFLLSPFQQRNRLIVELVIIVFGVLIGVVPRSRELLDQARERTNASELNGLISKNTQITSGSVTIRPIASSHYKKQHLLAFLLTPNSGSSIPSIASRYDVKLSPISGVIEAEKVTYSYEIVALSEENRLLLVYVDNQKQNDSAGLYQITVQVGSEKIPPEYQSPMEIVLSNTQETTKLFGKDGIDLSALTDQILDNSDEPIAKAKVKLKTSLLDYEMETERIASLPLQMTAVPTVDQLQEFVEDNKIYKNMTDTSTTKDILEMEEISQEQANQTLQYPTSVLICNIANETLVARIYLPDPDEVDIPIPEGFVMKTLPFFFAERR